MDPEELAQAIRQEEEAADAACARGDLAAAPAHQQHADALKGQLWGVLHEQVQRCLNTFWKRYRQACARAGLDRGDLDGEVYLVFLRRVRRFDPARQPELWPFLNCVFRNALLSILRHRRRDPLGLAGSAEDQREEIATTGQGAAEEHLRRSEIRQHHDTICRQMFQEGWRPDYMMAYRLYRVWDHLQQTIASLMDRSLGWVNKAIQGTEEEVKRRWGNVE